MKKVIATAGAVGLAALAFQIADAAVMTGTLSKTANTCPTAIGAINGDDCSYNNSFTEPAGQWVGPDRGSAFYASSLANGNWLTEPTPGDGKVSPTVTANLTIGVGNVVSGTIVIGAAAFHNFSAGPSGRGEDSWTSATITLAPKAADSATTNTVVIGSAGFPTYLQAANASDQFPSETAADSNAEPTPDDLWWAGPSATAMTVQEGNTGTTGTMATSDVAGWTCTDVDANIATGACGSGSSFRARGNFENIVLKITRTTAGDPIAVEGFLVQGGTGNILSAPNWVAWTFSAAADTDGDGAPDITDNCSGTANNTGASAQCDSNGDGYGNRCDGDLNSNLVTNAQDYAIFRSRLGTVNAEADINCNGGNVNAQDYAIFRTLLGSAPGPSGYHP